jgi:hypothetical protein
MQPNVSRFNAPVFAARFWREVIEVATFLLAQQFGVEQVTGGGGGAGGRYIA